MMKRAIVAAGITLKLISGGDVVSQNINDSLQINTDTLLIERNSFVDSFE